MSNLAYGTFTITNLSAVTSVDVYYYNSTSSTSLSGGSWSTDTPTWTNGRYIWSKTVTTWEQGVTTESEPVCITGQKGSTGAAGQSVTKITQQYALGTSSTTAPTSGWSTTMPTFESGKFYWTRSEIVWANPTSTTHTTAVLANGITSANTTAAVANTNAQSAVSTANTANQTANTANQTANTANQNAQNAVSIANGKNTIYYQASKPTGGTYKAGDTWFHLTEDGYRLYEYDTTARDWVQKSMDGKSITAGTITAAEIQAGAITSGKLATDSIQSRNYVAGTGGIYSADGTFLDLTNGNIYSPNFGINNTIDNIDNGAYIRGSVYASDGTIGSDINNYWYIGNYYDYNQGQSAMLRSHGTAAIQLGDSNTWRVATDRIHTSWNDDSTSGEAFRLHYPSYGGKYWDSGLHVPTSATDKLLYIRNASTSTSLENLQNDINDTSGGHYWNYQFYLTSNGNLYAKNIYIMDDNGNTTQIGGTDGVYLLKSGGTITGDLQVNGAIKNSSGSAITLQTNLASTSAVTLTGNSTSPIKLGVTGTLPVANGGTGNTNYTSGGVVYVSNTNPKTLLSNAAGTSGHLLASGGSGAPTWVNPGTLTVAAATKATQDGDGNVIKTTYLKLSGGNVTGPVNFGDSVSIDDLNAGTLIVTGNASFVNNINVDSINGVQVGETPKFTDTVTTVSTTGTGNAITAISASNGAITATKGATYLTGITSSQVTTALGYTPYNATNPNGYTSNTGTVKKVRVQASSPLQSSTSTEQTVSLDTTISFTNQNANVVLAGPSSGNAAAPAFRALVAADIPTLALTKISGTSDLQAIEAIADTSTGLLKKTGANTWTLDTNTYLTGITSSQVTTALGFTPYNATNPNGYTTNTGTVTKVTAGSGLKINTNTSGGDITTTGTINHINSVTAQTTQALYPIKIDAQGHISAYGSAITSWALSSITGADDLKAIEVLTGTSGFLKKKSANTWQLDTTSYVPTTRKVNGHVLSSDVSVTKSDVGLGQVANALQITDIGSQDGQLVLTFGDGTTSNRQVTISAYQQSSVTSAQKATGDQNGNRIYTNYAASLDWTLSTRTLLLKSKSGAQLSSVTIPDTTYTFDGTYNASSNKAATVSTVTNAINALDGNLNNTTPGVGKTLTAFSQTDGKVSATFGNISITKSQISDFPSTMTPAAHTHDDRYYTETEINNRLKKYISFSHYSNAASSNNEKYYKININSYIGWMLNFTIKIYHGYKAFDLQISGYNYGNNHWYAPAAVILGASVTDAVEVNFGYDSAYYLWIAIPANSYTGIGVTGFTNGYQQIDNWEDLFTITMVEGLPSTVQTTKTVYRPWYRDETVNNAINADKFSSAQSITLTGDTTGTVSSQAGWSIATTTNQLTAIPASTLNTQEAIDNFLTASKFQFGIFKTSEANNIGMGSNDGMILSLPWSSTQYGAQIALDDTSTGAMKFRGKSTSWGSWRTVIHDGNYTDYTVKKDGTGASGSWGISITGNATTATEFSSNATVTLTGDTTGTSAGSKKSWSIATTTKKLSQTTATALSSFTDTTALIYTAAGGSNTVTDKPTSVDAFGCLSLKTADGWYGQLLISSNTATGLYWRTATSLSGGWKKLLDSTNYTDYTVTKTGSGASGSWGISITGNAATATSATSATTASKLGSSNVGAADRPIYLSAGTATQTTYRMAATNTVATAARAITDNLETGIWYVSGTNSTDLYSQTDGVAYVNKYSDSWIHEIYGDYRTGQIALRGKNNGTWQAWRKVLDSSNYTNYMGNYVTLTTEQTITGRKTFENLAAVTFKPSSGTDKCNINYNATLGALVFSF